jgi:Protein of unknown function (DUF3151)
VGKDARMTDAHSISFTPGTPETVLPPPDEAAVADLAAAAGLPADERRAVVRAIAARSPRCLEAWATLAELAPDDVSAYAFARVGYHRGLDTLRGAGWRGSGYVRWRYPSNRGFLRSLEALRAAAEAIGEDEEEVRCALFLRQLDPDWDRREAPEAAADQDG